MISNGPSISVVIPTHQRRDLVLDLLRDIARQKFDRSFEVIVVVDGSRDGTGDALRAFRPDFPLRIIEQDNLGLARARNAGAAQAKGEVVLFLDDDMEAHPLLLQKHWQSHDQGAEVVQGHIPVHSDAPANIMTRALDSWVNDIARRQSAPEYKPNYEDFIGGQTSIRRSLFEAMGGFDERFTAGGSYGNEDAELGYRLIRSGHKITFNAEAISRQRCRVDAETFLERARQLGRGDVAIVRKHPELSSATFSAKVKSSTIHRVIYRPVLAFPWLAARLMAPVRRFAITRVNADRKDRWTARLFFAARSVEYWRGVSEAGGVPRPRPMRVLVYHAIADLAGDPILEPYGVPRDRFSAHLDLLRNAGYRFIEPAEFVRYLDGRGGLPRKALLLTFDDCYVDLRDTAAPLLSERGIHGVAFAVTGHLGGTNAWDRIAGARPLALLSGEDLLALSQKQLEIGAHSRTHSNLCEAGDATLMEEIAGSLVDLEHLGLAGLRLFAYPKGLHDARVREAARRSGARAAFTVDAGRVHPGQDPARIPRVEILRRDAGWRFRLKVALAGHRLAPRARMRHYFRRLFAH